MEQLADGFGRIHDYLRISVTDRCNLRCRYCMPPGGIDAATREELLSYEELFRIARVLAKRGVNKVRVTGGEPFVRRDLPLLFAKLSQIPELERLAVTTNGQLIGRHLEDLRNETRLSRINFSLDSLDPERYRRVTRGGKLKPVLESIDRALELGFKVKVNTVALSGLDEVELKEFLEFISSRDLTLRFIEFMPLCGEGWSADDFYPLERLRRNLLQNFEIIEQGQFYRPAGAEGKIGFIGSLSESFCGNCSRLRISSRGEIYSCLFSASGRSIRELLRSGVSDDELAASVEAALADKNYENSVPAPEEGNFDKFSPEDYGFIRQKGG